MRLTMALPFALRILVPRARDVIDRQGRLALALEHVRRGPFLRHVLDPPDAGTNRLCLQVLVLRFRLAIWV